MTIDRTRVLFANRIAADYFCDHLHAPSGQGPRDYLLSRGVSSGLLDGHDWAIGYAPPAWTGLLDQLGAWGFTDQEALESGLALTTRRGTLVDRFRERVIFGIHDATDGDEITGFVGRRSPRHRDPSPKYLNSPTTPAYDKSRTLFGLAEQVTSMQLGARPMIVEGPLDVLAVASHGLPVAPISPCGTALTHGHAELLRPALRSGALVAYDADAAGQRASVNAYERLSTITDSLRAVVLPAGEDPASVATVRPDALAARIRDAAPLSEHLVHQAVAPFLSRTDNAEVRVSALHAATRTIARMQPADVAQQVAWLSDRLGFSHEVVTRHLTEAFTSTHPTSPGRNSGRGRRRSPVVAPSRSL